jgi:uncharacterized protein (TIGR04141 family)
MTATGTKKGRTAASDPPVQSLNIFLIKTGTKSYEDAIEDDEFPRLTKYDLKKGLGFQGAVFLAPQRKAPPKWLDLLREGASGDLLKLYNASTSAVLFVRASKRIFALTFGYGRSLLLPGRIERSFGLRVVLNAVDEEGLRSVDTKTVQELTVHTRRQTSRASRLSEFGVDKEEDLLGSVAGVPRDESFARVVAGADALQLRARVSFTSLGDKCKEVLKLYKSGEYKKRGFEFVDHVRRVADPELIGKLDLDLERAFQNQNFNGVHMAPPEIVNWDTLDGFSFTKQTEPESELNPSAFIEQIRKPEEISVRRLKSQRVFVHGEDLSEPRPSWPVYRTIVAERQRSGRRYVLSGGEWFEIEKSFVDRINNRVQKITSANLGLPAAKAGQVEGEYNKGAARKGLYCADKKLPRIDGDRIELCDLYESSSRSFVHVKWWKSSQKLSHLFGQAKVSAEAFLSDREFRAEARALLKKQASTLATHIPDARPDSTKYRVVFAIIKGGQQGWRTSLPFFSKLHLVRSAESLRTLGFDVRLERIEVKV